MTLRAAVVGAGLMGTWHARYAARAGARVVAVADLDQTRAAALARRFPGARAFGDLAEGLRAGPVDVVHVCTARATHAALAEAALAAGAHVLVEKPAACSEQAARRLVDLARLSGRALCPVHQLPFQPGFQRLLRAHARLGRLVSVAHVVASAGGQGRPQAERRQLLADLAPHTLSLFRALLGPRCGDAGWHVARSSADDLEFAAQCGETSLRASFSLRARPTRNQLAVSGSGASARVDLFHGFATFETGRPSRASKLAAPFQAGAGLLARAGANLLRRVLAREPAFPGLLALVGRFYAAVEQGRLPPIEAEELVESVRLVELLERAASD